LCGARESGDPEAFPEMSPAHPVVKVRLESLLCIRGGRCLLVRSTNPSLLRGLWVLPSLERARTLRTTPRSPSRAFRRWLEEHLSVDAARARFLARVRHTITFRRFTVDAFVLREPGDTDACDRDGLPDGAELSDDRRWARLALLGRSVPVPSLVLKILRHAESA
jgi:hypothetical protein